MAEYRSHLSAERIQQLRAWHDDVSASLHALGDHDVEYLGMSLHVPSGVFPPTPTSHLLGEQVRRRVEAGHRVLDMGCGAGANAILAAQITGEVDAVDINPAAVRAVIANADRNGVADRVTAYGSDVFDSVAGDFDVIVFDPPFRWFEPRDMLERAFTDENYWSLGRFMREVGVRLRPGGEVLMFFGTSGDVDHLDQLIEESALQVQTIAELEMEVRDQDTRYFVLSLRHPN